MLFVFQTMYTGASLDNNHWHTVNIKRRARRVELRVDEQPVTKGTNTQSSSVGMRMWLNVVACYFCGIRIWNFLWCEFVSIGVVLILV